jgi:hypothetical protein
VDPQAHPLLNATAIKKEIAKEVKGPYGQKELLVRFSLISVSGDELKRHLPHIFGGSYLIRLMAAKE